MIGPGLRRPAVAPGAGPDDTCNGMNPTWLLIPALVLGAHFTMTYNVPARAGRGWSGWPFAVGDWGLFGAVHGAAQHRTLTELAGAALGAGATVGFVMAALSVVGLWLPGTWWHALALAASAASLVLMGGYLGRDKLPALTADLLVIAVATVTWLLP